MAEGNKTLAQLLRKVITEDRSLLGRRDDLIEKLNALVPGEQQRDYQPLKRAILDFNVAETMLLADGGSDEDKEAAKKAVLQIQLEASVQAKRAQSVVDILVEAMGWHEDTVAEASSFVEEITDANADEVSIFSEVEAFNVASEAVEPPKSWVCPNCGNSRNFGKFCVQCGHGKNQPITWNCPVCGHGGNAGSFCTNCGYAKGAPVPVQPTYQMPGQPAGITTSSPKKKTDYVYIVSVVSLLLLLCLVIGIKFGHIDTGKFWNSTKVQQVDKETEAFLASKVGDYPAFFKNNSNFPFLECHMDTGIFLDKSTVKIVQDGNTPIIEVESFIVGNANHGGTKESNRHKTKFKYDRDNIMLFREDKGNWKYVNPDGPMSETRGVVSLAQAAYYIAYGKKFFYDYNSEGFYKRMGLKI